MIALSAAWDQLLSTALVGTERRTPPAALADVATLVGADLAAAGPEPGLLAAAGVLAAYRRAGFRAAHDEQPDPPPAADPDERPPAPTRAEQILALVLTGQVPVMGGPVPLVAFWLDHCRATGHKVPGRLLPTLADLATRVPDLRESVVAAGGPTLVWLAGHNDRWDWAATASTTLSDDTWRTGDHATRFAGLRRLRSSEPERARALAQETWAGEKAIDRAEIVLSSGLGPADEPFLEAALDDRAKSVRRAAAGLLASLPGSRLGQRMAGRLRPLRHAGGVTLPDEPDPTLRRDGVVDDDPPLGLGRRAWWLTQMVAATPLDFWRVELIEETRQPELRLGWSVAAVRQRNQEWAAALLRRTPLPQSGGAGAADADDAALLGVLPAGEAQAVLERLLSTRTDAALAPLLAAVPGPWPRSLVEAVVARIGAAKAKTALTQCLPYLLAADPALTDEVDEWLAGVAGNDNQRRQIIQTVQALSIRRTIAEAFRHE